MCLPRPFFIFFVDNVFFLASAGFMTLISSFSYLFNFSSKVMKRVNIGGHVSLAVAALIFLWLGLISSWNSGPLYLSAAVSAFIAHNDFQTALDQSYGFFDNINQGDWQKMKERIQSTPDCAVNCEASGAAAWYQSNWEPAFTCQHERRVGRWGDGGKWVCDPYRITTNKQSCLVYSVGSYNDFSFEEGVWLDVSPECEVHTFDPTIGEQPSNLPVGKNIHFHPWGLASQDEGSYKTLPSIIKELGHTGREIDIFKIDCEGCEWDTYKSWFDGNTIIRQIQVEVHWGTEGAPPTSAQNFMLFLKSKGYVIFHKEPNIQSGGGSCIEYAFLLLNLENGHDVR